MSFNYENYLLEKLSVINNQLREQDDAFNLHIEVANEQAFSKNKTFKPDTIYVVIKKLTSTITYESETQPIQLIVLCEQNNIDRTLTLFNTFAEQENWKQFNDDTTYIKQQYSKPVVVSNFNEIGYGYRSVVYLSGTLYILNNVLDIKSVRIECGNSAVDIQPLNFTLSYAMSGNTQQNRDELLASTVKQIATLSIGFTIPFTQNGIVEKILNIANGETSGNTTFAIKYKIGSSNTYITHNMKLTSANITTAPNAVPGLQLSFMR